MLVGATRVQAQPTGQWTIEFGEWQSANGGQVRFQGGNSGTLEITARGDSVFATYRAENVEQALTGRMQNGKLELRGSSLATLNMNGTPTEVTLVTEMDLTPAEGMMTGVHRTGREGQPLHSRKAAAQPARQS